MPRHSLTASWRPVILCAMIIVALTHFPNPNMVAPGVDVPDKLIHVLLYLPLGYLFLRALTLREAGNAALVAAGVAGAVAFAALDEWTQGFVPGRTPSVWDSASDIAGFCAGLGAYKVAIRRKMRYAKPSGGTNS